MKVIIVGAGPIGSYTARLLQKKGIEPQLIEEHKEIGRPVHCAGVVGSGVFKKSLINLPLDSISLELDGAEFFYGGESFIIRRKAVAYVIDRAIFDKTLGAGLDVKYETKFLGLEKVKNGYIIETDKGDFRADIVIGADGAVSKVREAADLEGKVSYFRGAQLRIATKKDNKNFVKVYMKKPFFSWIVPEDNGKVKAGIISKNPFSDLKRFLQEAKLEGEIIDKFGGIIPFGMCQIVNDNVVLVGDAACQVKPLTHGGIFYGMRGAEILVDCLMRGELSEYDKLWRKRFGNEIRAGLYIKKMYQNLDEKDLSIIFEILKMSIKKIEKVGDFESHLSTLIAIIKDKAIQNRLGSVLWHMLKSIYQ